MDQNQIPQRMTLTDPKLSFHVGDDLIAGVITRAVCSEKRRFGLTQDMITALKHGAAGTKEGTADAFLFRAMVDRLLEEYHKLEK